LNHSAERRDTHSQGERSRSLGRCCEKGKHAFGSIQDSGRVRRSPPFFINISHFHSDNSPTAPPIDIFNNIQGIDWSIVAEKVSDRSSIKRTPDECRIKWVGNLHPKVNHGIWTVDELEKLHHLTRNQQAQEGGKIDWVKVARDLGVCHAIYCSLHLFLTSLLYRRTASRLIV